jgi:hypothetical protein
MKVQLFAAVSIALLLQPYSAESRQVTLDSDAHEGKLRGAIIDGSFLESENTARCRQKCEKKDAANLSKCQQFCDDVCKSDVRNAGDKCKRPCDYVDCDNSSDDGTRSDSCLDSSDCESAEYCKFFEGDCEADSKGRCTKGGKDDLACTRELDPVCGCDQREYDNKCEAENFGVSIDFRGECDYDVTRTAEDFRDTCRKDNDCDDGYYCKPLFQECSTDVRDGFCTKIPKKDRCKKLPTDKVCTCDNKTEKNECYAEHYEQGVKSRGEC